MTELSSPPEIQSRALELRKILQRASYEYYVLDAPAMEDSVYDAFYHELQNLEAEYPQLITVDSPTQRVGESPIRFVSVQHHIPLYSLENAFTSSDVTTWQERCQKGLEKQEFIDSICEL